MNKSIPITQDELKKQLSYCPKKGVFTWIISKKGCSVGRIAGGCAGHIYKRIRVNGILYYQHRLAWLYVYGVNPNGEVDHINHNPLDNRICNLREVSHTENHKNRGASPRNTSGFVGVYSHAPSGKWRSCIKINGKQKHLGLFHKKYDAVMARISAEEKYGFHRNHGNHARTMKIIKTDTL